MDGAVRSCILFEGLSEAELGRALAFFHAVEREYAKGEALNRPGDPLKRFGLVLSGLVHVHSYETDPPAIMATVSPGATFGESLCFLELPAPVHVFAAERCRVLWLSAGEVKRAAGAPFEQELHRRFTAMIALKALSMNDRIQVLSRRSLREKLNTLLAQHGRVGEEVALPFDREHMAAYLGADRSALSRELSRMRAEGLIEFHKNRFKRLRP